MKIKDIKRHLQPYSIINKRSTTINHAFASAIAPNDSYNEKKIKRAIETLGQDPANDLFCVYCGKLAETWDHAFGLVKDSNFSGYGHVVGNLVPCCKSCNSKKGNKNWKVFLSGMPNSENRIKLLSKYFNKYINVINYDDIKINPDYKKLNNIKNDIFRLMKKADILAFKIRSTLKK